MISPKTAAKPAVTTKQASSNPPNLYELSESVGFLADLPAAKIALIIPESNENKIKNYGYPLKNKICPYI